MIDRDFYVAMNVDEDPIDFRIPAAPSGRRWRRVVDTSLSSPDDLNGVDEGPDIEVMSSYRVGPRSLIILASQA